MPVPAREAENTVEQELLLCQLCRAKVAANTRSHLMTASLHCLSLPSPTESWDVVNSAQTQKPAHFLGFGRGFGEPVLGEGCSGLSAGSSGANPNLVQVFSSSLPTRIVPKLPGAASGPRSTQTLPAFSPTPPLLPACRYAPSKSLHYQHSF